MSELILRYSGILALILGGAILRRASRKLHSAESFARIITLMLFPAYIFWSLVDLDPETLSFSAGIRIAWAVFIVATIVFFIYRIFSKSPYPFVAASRNFRSLGIPLLYFRFYDSILQEVAIFAVLGIAVFESLASVSTVGWWKKSTVFAWVFFSAFASGSLAYWMGYSGWIDYSYLNIAALLGKGVAGYSYSVLSLFFIGYAIPLTVTSSSFWIEIRKALPILISQTVVWPVTMATILFLDGRLSGFVTWGVVEVASALAMLSFMPASVTSTAVLAKNGNTDAAKWVVASTILFLLYCPYLIRDSFVTQGLATLDSSLHAQ